MTTNAAPSSHRRSVAALFAGVALMSAVMIGASAVSSLVAAEAAGPAWGGVPNAAAVLGTALGALALGAIMARRGRRAGLVVGYASAVAGALLGVVAVRWEVLPLLLGAMLMLGVGNGSAQLSRYAAADLYPARRRGFALGLLVWAGTVGAVIGPNLLGPAGTRATAFALPPATGVFVLAFIGTAGALGAVVAMPRLRPATRTFAAGGLSPTMLALLRLPSVKLGLAAMVTAQLVMVAVMTATPLHIHHEGHGLETVGLVLSAHTLGMFALAPLSGRLTDRFGSSAVIIGGLATLAAATALAFVAPTADGAVLAVALFLLGYGWNLNLVAGSALLTGAVATTEQARLQGSVEALVWGTSAAASAASGPVFAAGGYSLLALLAGALLVVPAVVRVRLHGHFQSAITEPGPVGGR